jgi:hypothetical protein
MRISLLLNNMSQNQSVLVDDAVAFNGWLHGPAGSNGGGGGKVKLPYLSLREEEWGGVVVHGPSMSVYEVDTVAYKLLQRMKAGESLQDLTDRPQPASADDVDSFIQSVKKFGIDSTK